MLQFFMNHFDAILSAIVAFFAGGFCVHLYSKMNSDNTKVSQKNITNNGDVAGRDINKK